MISGNSVTRFWRPLAYDYKNTFQRAPYSKVAWGKGYYYIVPEAIQNRRYDLKCSWKTRYYSTVLVFEKWHKQ